jgi:hypothetical protein
MNFSCTNLNEMNYLVVPLIATTFSIGFLYTATYFDPHGPSSGIYTITYGSYAYSASIFRLQFIHVLFLYLKLKLLIMY